MHQIDSDLYAGSEDLARALKISTVTLRNWIDKKKLETETTRYRSDIRCFSAEYIVQAIKKMRPATTEANLLAWIQANDIERNFGKAVLEGMGFNPTILDVVVPAPATVEIPVAEDAGV
jgi:hypothetical protein